MSQARKKRFVDSQVQGRLLLQTAKHWACFLGTSTVLLFAMEIVTSGFSGSIGSHAGTMLQRYAPILLVLAVLLPLFALDMVRLTHRFAGPMTRLRTALREAGAGKPVTPLQFRDGDFWQESAQDFNAVIKRLAALEARAAVTIASEPAAMPANDQDAPVGETPLTSC